MPHGGGPYGPECEALLKQLGAAGVMVCVVGGARCDGFSVSMRADWLLMRTLPAALRDIADQIEADINRVG
jgi:hypothetical protein